MSQFYHMDLKARLRWKDTILQRASQWANGRDTGMSSMAIYAHMMGVQPGRGYFSHPYDPGDLGRCLRLLRLIPEWEPRIHEMAVHSKAWAVLAFNWFILKQSMLKETGPDFNGRAPKTYDLMRDLLDRAERATKREPTKA